jgi:hypothetical protein
MDGNLPASQRCQRYQRSQDCQATGRLLIGLFGIQYILPVVSTIALIVLRSKHDWAIAPGVQKQDINQFRSF